MNYIITFSLLGISMLPLLVRGFSIAQGMMFLLKSFEGESKTDDGGEFRKSSSSQFVSILNEEERSFTSSEEYIKYLRSISNLPKGFQVATIRFPFQPKEIEQSTLLMNLSLILLDKPSRSFAAAFTSNRFPGGPLLVGKQRLQTSESLQAVLINNKISNVYPSGVEDFGYADSDSLCETVAEHFQLSSKAEVFPSSTGIIGWRLPVETMKAKIPLLRETLQRESILPVALGIMTTDRYPKIRSYRSKDGSWSLVGIAKGAGMIEPNLATMLSYLLTDLPISRHELQVCLQKVLFSTFNAISVDGDQSTSDTVLFLSSQGREDPLPGPVFEELEAALRSICRNLSEDIVRNGEGTQHVLRIRVKGLKNAALAKKIGKGIVNSSLVKCAMAGNDPNVGRIVGAIGSVLGSDPEPEVSEWFERERVRITLGEVIIFDRGGFSLDPQKEEKLYRYLQSCQLYPGQLPESERLYPPHERCVELLVEFLSNKKGGEELESCKDGTEEVDVVEVIGSDLTREYVEINADYRS